MVGKAPTYARRSSVVVNDEAHESPDEVVGRGGRIDVLVASGAPLLRGTPVRVRVQTGTVMVETEGNAAKPVSLRPFDLPVPASVTRLVVDVDGETVVSTRGDSNAEVVVVRRDGDADVVCPNTAYVVRPRLDVSQLDYPAAMWYYEEDQINVTYSSRLDRFKQNEGARWMNVFYGGRETRYAQGSASQQVDCDGLGGLIDMDRDLTGFAVDMARHIVPLAMDHLPGKVLWLLNEAHGHALVHRWLQCEGREWLDTGRIAVFGSYRNDDSVRVQQEVKQFLRDTFNADDNVHGERCKLIVGGAVDLGVGVTFTEVRHIVLDLTSSFFNVLQQMGRGERLCKHARLDPSDRTLDFHLPVPVLTSGWGTPELPATQRTFPGGIGAVRVSMTDFVHPLRVGTRTETLAAPLHVPVHAFDTLADLQR